MKIRKELAVLAQYSCDLPLLWSKKYSDLFACCEESLHFLHINEKKNTIIQNRQQTSKHRLHKFRSTSKSNDEFSS